MNHRTNTTLAYLTDHSEYIVRFHPLSGAEREDTDEGYGFLNMDRAEVAEVSNILFSRLAVSIGEEPETVTENRAQFCSYDGWVVEVAIAQNDISWDKLTKLLEEADIELSETISNYWDFVFNDTELLPE